MWKTKRELMERWEKRTEEEMGIAKKRKIKGSPTKVSIEKEKEEKSWLKEIKDEKEKQNGKKK